MDSERVLNSYFESYLLSIAENKASWNQCRLEIIKYIDDEKLGNTHPSSEYSLFTVMEYTVISVFLGADLYRWISVNRGPALIERRVKLIHDDVIVQSYIDGTYDEEMYGTIEEHGLEDTVLEYLQEDQERMEEQTSYQEPDPTFGVIDTPSNEQLNNINNQNNGGIQSELRSIEPKGTN
jgi:hypothetical protein